PVRQRIGPANPGATVVVPAGLRAVNRAVSSALIARFPDVLHDVDLAAGRPADRINVGAQHPECGPDSLASREFDARLHATVSPGPFAFSQHPGRSIILAAVALLAGLDNQLTAYDARVIRAGGVIFELLIAPATGAVTDIVAPFGRIRQTPVGWQKSAPPHQLRGGSGRTNAARQRCEHQGCDKANRRFNRREVHGCSVLSKSTRTMPHALSKRKVTSKRRDLPKTTAATK